MSLRFAIVDLESTFPNLTSQFAMPRHGVLAVGTAARDAGHEVEVYVEVLNGVPVQRLAEQDVVGASITAPNLSRVRTLFLQLKAMNQDIIRIVGGPHATISPAEVLEFAEIVVRDESEITIAELLNSLEKKSDRANVAGVSYRESGKIVHTVRRPYMSRPSQIEDLTLLRGYCKKSAVRQLISGQRSCGLVGASRGCPFPCSFCYENMIGGTGFRRRDVDSLIEDIRQKRDFFGTTRFWLTDSNFGTNLAHAQSVIEALVRADLGCQFTVLCRVEIGNHPQLLQLMGRAGVLTISIGMESLEDHRLKSINKRQSLEKIRRTIAEIHRHGIAVFGLFMVGFDGDTAATPWAIADFCQREHVEGLSIYCLTEYPALPGRTLPRHRICETNLDYYSGHFVTTFPKDVAPSELERNVFESLLAFYSLPRIAKSLASARHSLRFLVPLSIQMRRMNRISVQHQARLQEIESTYYDRCGQLNVERLVANPWIKTSIPTGAIAAWTDAAEGASDNLHDSEQLLSLT